MKGKKTGGRQKGTPNQVTVEARALCAGIVDDPRYQARLYRRALAGKLPPPIEAMLWHYAKGKPTEHINLAGDAALIARLDRIKVRNAQNKRPAVAADAQQVTAEESHEKYRPSAP